MKVYSYCNGVYNVTTYVRNGFERFHTMNAQCKHTKHVEPYHDACYQERFDFISYATPICHAIYYSRYGSWKISVNRAYFDCSPSTSRQFSRWLRENNIPVSLYDLKSFDRNREFENNIVNSIGDNIDIYWCDSDAIEYNF